MGSMAKGMGASTGQWSGGGGGGGGGGAPSLVRTGNSGGRGDGGSPAPINVYVGAEWAGMGPMEQAAAIHRAVQVGKRGSKHVRRN
jgi:hypothetical protein